MLGKSKGFLFFVYFIIKFIEIWNISVVSV